MFEIQSTLPDGGRADAVIQFPDRRLPIDAKFPREQVLALFESNVQAEIEEARHEFVRVMKAEAKRIKAYIQPENGTTDIALMYLPSETLTWKQSATVTSPTGSINSTYFPFPPIPC